MSKSEDLQALLDTVDKEAMAMLDRPYGAPCFQMQLFGEYAEQNLRKKRIKTKNGLTWNEEIMCQFLARDYSKVDAYRYSHPNSKTENLNTLYPKASRAAAADKIRARVEQIRVALKERALMSTTEFYARVSNLARGTGKDALRALEMVGKIRGEFQAEKGLPGSDGAPLVFRWQNPAEAAEADKGGSCK